MRLLLLVLAGSALAAAESAPTFYKDVLPVLQDHCQTCHRAGEIGPMPLMTYQQTRPYAAAIREAIQTRKMPPWGAQSPHLKFANDPSLSDAERRTVLDWIAAKEPEGNSADAPAPPVFTDGWNIGTPDLTLEMPTAYQIPASGTVDYTYVVLPLNFKENKWIQAAEIRPAARQAVHHVIAYVRAPGSPWLVDAKPGIPYVPSKPFDQLNTPKGWGEFLAGYAPGAPALRLAPNQGREIEAGSDIVLEVHYTPNGKPLTDQTRLGLTFAKQKPTERVMTIAAANGEFAIPPGNEAYPVSSETNFYGDGKIISFWPHMHVRGRSMRFELVEKGRRTTLLDVPQYDFHWQQTYNPDHPVIVHAGSKIECFATYNNSANNPYNPDPAKEVHWGDQSWEEMMIGFMELALPVNVNPSDVLVNPKDRVTESAKAEAK